MPSPVSSTAIKISLASSTTTVGLPSPDEPRMKDVIRIDGCSMIAVDDDVERAVAGQLGKLHAEDPTPHLRPVGPLGLEDIAHEAIEEDTLAVSDHQPRDLVLRPDRNVHRHGGEGELGDLAQRDRALAARVRPGVEVAGEQPGEERSLRVGSLVVACLGRTREVTLRCGPDRRRNEERGGQQRGRPGEREEPHVHVGLGLGPRERDDQEVLDLEPLRGRRQPLAVQQVLAPDPLLLQPHARWRRPCRPGIVPVRLSVSPSSCTTASTRSGLTPTSTTDITVSAILPAETRALSPARTSVPAVTVPVE